jgi:ribosomal protein L11 methylase PrmA
MKHKRDYSIVDGDRLTETTANRKDEREMVLVEPVKVDYDWYKKNRKKFHPYMLLEIKK